MTLSKNQKYYRKGKLEVFQELTEREGLVALHDLFPCFSCKAYFNYLRGFIVVHHDDEIDRGMGRGRFDRLVEWRRQLQNKNCSLMLLCNKCHKKRHMKLGVLIPFSEEE